MRLWAPSGSIYIECMESRVVGTAISQRRMLAPGWMRSMCSQSFSPDWVRYSCRAKLIQRQGSKFAAIQPTVGNEISRLQSASSVKSHHAQPQDIHC